MSRTVITTRDGTTTTIAGATVEAFRRALRGPLLAPEHAGFAEATRPWNGMVQRTPALVAQPGTAGDVAAAVHLARDHGLLLGVRGAGHNIAGSAVPEGGLVLDMSRMRAITVEREARLAHVGAGCLLGDVDRATQQHGLATVLGFVSEVGVAGLTLGGGLGYLTRRFGWTVDNLEELEVVTADGDIRIANRTENADLFWALRGGGGNFGVVTRFTYRLHDVGPAVYGGLIAWPFERADEVLAAYRTITAHAPRELAVWLVLLRAPPAPFVPQQWHGKRLCAMPVCYSGPLDEAGDALAPIRALGNPVVDLLREQPYTMVQSYLDATEPKGAHYYWKSGYLAGLEDGLLDAAREAFAACPIPGAQLGFLHLGGALNERAPDDGAVGNRDARYALGVKGMWGPDAPRADAFRDWVRAAWDRVRPFSTGGNYVNFQTADEGDDRVREAYGANYGRLVAIKRIVDPDNLFRANRNIGPEVTAGDA